MASIQDAISAALERGSVFDPHEWLSVKPSETIDAVCLGTLEARLRALAVAISAASSTLTTHAAAAHAAIDELFESSLTISSVDGQRCKARAIELHADVDAAEARKSAALEYEAVQVDAALELAAAVAASTPHDREMQETRLFALLGKLPDSPVEPPCVSFVNLESDRTDPLVRVRISAPGPATAADVCVLACAHAVRPAPDQVLCEVSLAHHSSSLGNGASRWHLDDMLAVLSQLATQLRASAALFTPTASSDCPRVTPLSIRAVVDSSSVRLVADLSQCKGLDSVRSAVAVAVIARICVAGLAVALDAPLAVAVSTTMQAPLQLPSNPSGSYYTPTISSAGVLYQPSKDSESVRVFGPDGTRLPAVLGLNKAVGVAFCMKSGLLVFVEKGSASERVVAVELDADPGKSTVRWTATSPDGIISAEGIAVMPEQGLVVVSSKTCRLLVFRIFDGSLAAVVPDRMFPLHLACDATSGTLYVSHGSHIGAFTWSEAERTLLPLSDEDLGCLTLSEIKSGNHKPIIVVPAANGFPSCLVCGSLWAKTLLVIALPAHRLVGKHTLGDGFSLKGLAADPYGSVIAVDNSSTGTLHVLSWPLPSLSF